MVTRLKPGSYRFELRGS